MAAAAIDQGVVIDVPQRMLFVFRPGQLAGAWPITVGRPDWPTPLGTYRIASLSLNPTWHVPPFQEHRLRVEFGFWPLTMMTRREFRDECERVLEIKFKDFCDQIEELALSAGMEHTREKREMDHFLWLARYQVKGQTAAEIKRFSPGMEGVTTDAITKAIRALARELELPLRDHTSTEIDSEKNANPTK